MPGSSFSYGSSVTDFFESVVYLTKPMPEPDTDYPARFLYFIRNLKTFNPDIIENFVKKEEPNAFNTIKKHNVGSSGFMTDKQKDYLEHYDDDDEATGFIDDEATGILDEDEATGLLVDEATGLLDEETDYIEDENATGLLTENPPIHFPTLLRVFTNETIQINKPVFRIGKEKSFVDYFVSNNNAVSRSHADIITRGQHYFVIDLNSKNKTYINGQPLPIQQECEIQNGNQLRLANEEFIFYT